MIYVNANVIVRCLRENKNIEYTHNWILETECVMTILDSPGLLAIDQQWLDLLWDKEMLTLSSLTHTP